jgi:hypothetical protein
MDVFLSVVKACPTPTSDPFRKAIALSAIRFAYPFNIAYQTDQDLRNKMIMYYIDTGSRLNLRRTSTEVLNELVDAMFDPKLEPFRNTIRSMIIDAIWYFKTIKRENISQESIQHILSKSKIKKSQLLT